MKKLLSILSISILFAAVLSAQTVSNIQLGQKPHSAVTVSFDASTIPQVARVRFIATSKGTCTDGVSGNTYPSDDWLTSATGILVNITGLAPNTQYQLCPEIEVSRT